MEKPIEKDIYTLKSFKFSFELSCTNKGANEVIGEIIEYISQHTWATKNLRGKIL